MKKPIQFGKYYLLERVNVGGMAEVFKAKAFGVEGFERLLAVKRILPNIAEDKEFIQMFIDEAKIAVQLNHANICQIFDLGKVNDSYFIALEYVHGKDLRAIYDRCKQRPEGGAITMPIAQSCFVVMKVCEGLDYAHNKRDTGGKELKLVHRDVSPQNIIVSYEGEVKLIDFGIAMAAGKASKTQAGILKGKFGYMSPEQVRGLPLDRRSDIFAVGIVLYELLTGERLFVGESDFSTLEKVRNVEILPPSTYNRKIPDELERIVLKALAKDVEDRYQNAIDLHDDLQAFMYSAGEFYARKDLAGWMKRSWAPEIEQETAKMEAHRQFTPEPIPALPPQPSPRVTLRSGAGIPPGPIAVAAGGLAHEAPSTPSAGPPPVAPKNGHARNGTKSGIELTDSDLDWDEEERETHVYDSPTDASDAIEAEMSDRQPKLDAALLADLSPDGAPVPSKRATGSHAVPDDPPTHEVHLPPPRKQDAPAPPSKNGASAAPPVIAPTPRATPNKPQPTVRPPTPAKGIAATQQLSAAEFLPLPTAPGLTDAPPSALRRPSTAAKGSKQPIAMIAAAAAAGVVIVGALLWLFVIAPGRPGDVQILTDPSDGVTVSVDGKPIHLDDVGRVKLPPGVYAVTVEHDGFQPWNDKVEVKAGDLVKRRVDLVPLAKSGFTLISEPAGATALLDGKDLGGVTPFKVEGLAPGTHQLDLRAGAKSWSQTIVLEPGKIVDVHAVLSAPGETPKAPVVAAPPVEKPHPTAPAPVEHAPVAAEPAERPHHHDDTPPDGEPPAREHHHAATPLPSLPTAHVTEPPPHPTERPTPVEKPTPATPPPATAGGDGFLRINSKPWTKIIIDGNDTGLTTPQGKLKLPAGNHRVVLVNPEFKLKESFSVSIKPGETETVLKMNLQAKTGSTDDGE